jgi:hypothetical protein
VEITADESGEVGILAFGSRDEGVQGGSSNPSMLLVVVQLPSPT